MDDHEDLETLGEQLYTIIYPKHKDNAGKLTGEQMNADCSVMLLCSKQNGSYFFHKFKPKSTKPVNVLQVCCWSYQRLW